MFKIGIDVGGTHVDFALVASDDRLIGGLKKLCDRDVNKIIIEGLSDLLYAYKLDLRDIAVISLGTTLAINSILEMKSLYKVGLIRLAGHAPDFPPAYSWPAHHRSLILVGCENISGGKEYNNKPISSFNDAQLINAVQKLRDMGAESLVINSVFSPIYAEEELRAKDIIRENFASSIPITLSHQVGSLGFIERENASILNGTLKKIIKANLTSLTNDLRGLGFLGECFITQNNGTLFYVDEAIEFPVKTIASGPVNSITGACKLAGCREAVLVDIGGTSTDIAFVEDGLPLYSLKGGSVAGIPCNLLVPEIHALAMGGASVIKKDKEGYMIGPQSLGAKLFEQCRTVGGEILTLYDVAQVLKHDDQALFQQIGITREDADVIMSDFMGKIMAEIDTINAYQPAIPILFVGGGSAIISEKYLPANCVRPNNYEIANAYGAALSEVAGHIDCIIEADQTRETALLNLEQQARAVAIAKGADETSLRVIEKKILPLHYMPMPLHRVIITVGGRLGKMSGMTRG